jgi:hypothetical protein
MSTVDRNDENEAVSVIDIDKCDWGVQSVFPGGGSGRGSG